MYMSFVDSQAEFSEIFEHIEFVSSTCENRLKPRQFKWDLLFASVLKSKVNRDSRLNKA